ncbi:MAG: BlaI/MecI/CopY family transcriptional regulator [Clostridia bacterium]
MDGRKRLPDAELSVMQAVWAHGGEVSRGDIEGALASHSWSVNTINTYLTRLCDKGYLSARREGRSNFYTPLVSQEKYREFDSRSVLQRLYGGSLGSFVAALTAEKPLAQSEIDELRRYLDEMSGKAGSEMTPFLLTLCKHSLLAAAVLALAAITKPLWRERYGARSRCALWLALAVFLLLPVDWSV